MPVDNNSKIWAQAEDYTAGRMSESELIALNAQLAGDQQFAASFQEAIDLLRSLEGAGATQKFRNTLQSIHQDIAGRNPKPRTISLKAHYLRSAAVAAGVAILTSIATLWIGFTATGNKNSSKYSELRREIDRDIANIKQSQSKIINDLNKKSNNTLAENKYSGTGFALTNDGYLVTNYHVTEGADSLYIQTKDGSYYKAFIVSFDQSRDIAILKVQQKDFRFSKSGIPYTFATAKSGLGERVYTLGFPQDEIVYSEGYISASNGYMGDSSQYRLEMPAHPGQSGAPVLDDDGNIVAIVTGKEARSEGTTFAVSTKSMLKFLRSMPKSSDIHLPKSNKLARLSRTQQIEKLQDFTCIVKVYK